MQLFYLSRFDMTQYRIKSYCRINDSKVVLDGRIVASIDDNDSSPWMLQAYRQLDIQYSKFHKMDTMCKAGFIATELLVTNDDEKKDDWGIQIYSNSSSMETDVAFQKTIGEDNYYPAPSLFVYTLPNIVTGEIAIRYKIYGETSCHILECFSSDILINEVQNIMNEGRVSTMLCGWVNQDEDHTDVLMLRIEKNSDSGIQLTNDNILKIWKI